MLLSIIIYVLFAFFMYAFGRNEWVDSKRIYRLTGQYRVNWTYNTVFLLALFIFMSALRFRVGVDCESYVGIYNNYVSSGNYERSIEPFFKTIVKFVATVGGGRILFLGILSALEIIPFYYAFRTRKYLYPYFGLLIVLGPFYLIWMNGMRQAIAACIFVLASVYIIDQNKKILASLLILFAAQIHSSAYALLIFLFLPTWDLFKNRTINIALLLFCVVAGQYSNYALSLLNHLSGIQIEGDAYLLGYVNAMDTLLMQDAKMGFGPRRLIILFLSILVLWYGPQMKKHFSDKFFIFSFNLFFIHVCLCENLFSNVSLVFRRPFYYTYPYELICFTYLLYFLKQYNMSKNRMAVYMFTTLISCAYIFLQCIAEAGAADECSLYKFYLGQQ